jgi:hypothetical protein
MLLITINISILKIISVLRKIIVNNSAQLDIMERAYSLVINPAQIIHQKKKTTGLNMKTKRKNYENAESN